VEKGYERYVREHSIDVGFTKEFVKANRQAVDRILDVMLADPPSLAVFLGHVVGRCEYDATPRLKDLRIPTLVLVGDDEDHGAMHGTTHKQFAEQLAAAICGAKLAVLPNQGHYYLYADPVMTHRVIREFLMESG
jgi:pimeloyl-ACP methyl ester carboxylesterase